jgi:tRNA-dihydrouridine synthase
MEILAQRSLVSDHRLSHILNLHLRENAVMRSEMVSVNETIKGLQKDISELKKANSRRPAALAGAGRSQTARNDQE